MIYDYELAPGAEDDSTEPDDQKTINPENEFVNAKSYLQKASTATGDNLYDHLSEVLNKILAERPENIIDFFEEYSRKVKERRFVSGLDHLEDMYVEPGRFNLATRTMTLLKPIKSAGPSTVDPADMNLADMSQNDLLQLLLYFEQVGLGLPRTDMFCLMLSLRKLTQTEQISSIRFWGVIYGLYKNYYIMESELKEEEYLKRNAIYQEEQQQSSPPPVPVVDEKSIDPNAGLDHFMTALHRILKSNMPSASEKIPRVYPPAPKNLFVEPPEPPAEPSGVGINSKVYYVSNDIDGPWVQLPDLKPKHIRVARQIYKALTGNLEQPINTYPEFPGSEKEYLRAQIARISAGTQISPLGYYTFGAGGGEGGEDAEEEDLEDEEAEIGGTKTNYKVNPKYDPPPLKDLTDGSMSFWVHHAQYILRQGRTSWWSPTLPDAKSEADDEELGEEEEEEAGADAAVQRGPEPETGPPLLTPLSEDSSVESVPAWSVRCSSAIIENFATAVVRSHIWPGAYAFATQGKLFKNVYLGNGLKYQSYNFSPEPLPPVQQDYPSGPEIMEISDPTGAEEEEYRIAHLPKPKPVKAEGGEEEEEEAEEEEDDEDD